MKQTVLALVTAAMLTVAGCATNPDGSANQNRRAQTGAIIGAIGGGVVGKQTGGDRQSTVIGAILGGVAGAAIGNQLDKQQQELEAELAATQVEIDRVDDRTIGLTFADEVTFDFGSSTLKPSFREDLDAVIASARRYQTTRVRIVGHTDNVGSEASNLTLSRKRAQSVADYMMDRGVARSAIEAVGRGETQPVASNSTAFGRSANRRVEILLIKE